MHVHAFRLYEVEEIMGHNHDHGPSNYGRAFAIGIALNVAFIITELIYGRLAHSLALVADAGHNLSDVLSLGLAWGASVLARRQPSPRRTYGLRRTSILAAVINAVILLIAIGGIAWEAIQRFAEPAPVAGQTVIVVATIGIAVNGATAFLFMAGRKHDLNIRGAFLHMVADAGVSLGVVLAGLAMLATGWTWLDPAMSLLIAAAILAGTWGLLRDSVNLALDAVPQEIDVTEIEAYLARLPGVAGIHDLHIWGMSTTETALTCHLVVPAGEARDALLTRVTRELHDRFGIEHATLQVETGDATCSCCLTPGATVG
jgi:cobalt-zinc-cadmium efflux system protein